MERCKQRATSLALVFVFCLVGAAPSASAYADTDALEVRYTGSDSEQVVMGSDLFAQVDNGLPGDVFVGSMNIANASDDACEVFVNAQDVIAEGPLDMLDRIPFKVEARGASVYEGMLADAGSAEPISLGVLEAGDVASVDCMAIIPSELTSEYADAAVGMNMAVGMRAYTEANGAGNPLVSTGATDWSAPLVQAGDATATVPFVLGVVAAAGAVIWCAWKRRIRMW